MANYPFPDIGYIPFASASLKKLDDHEWMKNIKPAGVKFDQDKPRYDLLDPEFLEGVAQVLTFGARKYDAHNWRNGLSTSRLIAASYRHLTALNKGEDIDPETGLSHAYHMACNAQFLAWMIKNKPELDDRWKA